MCTSVMQWPQMFPATPPKPIGQCDRCPADHTNEHFVDDLTQIRFLKPVRDHARTPHGRKSHRLHEDMALLCSKHLTKHLAQKEY